MVHKLIKGKIYDENGFQMNKKDIVHDLNRIKFLEKKISILKKQLGIDYEQV